MSLDNYLNFVLSLVFVLGLIALAAWGYRRFFMWQSVAARLGLATNRLRVVEVRGIGARRGLALAQCDGVE